MVVGPNAIGDGVEGTQRAAALVFEDHDRCFSTMVLVAFRQVFFNAKALSSHYTALTVC